MTVRYVDSSALLKRIFIEDGSDLIRESLRDSADRGDVVASCDLAWVEVSRALLRAGTRTLDADMADAFSGIARSPVSELILERARRIGPSTLRSLDAIHLAAAVGLGATELLTFDERLAVAARGIGLSTVP